MTKLRKKKQPNDNSIYNYTLKTVESKDQLCDLNKVNKHENKPQSGRNSYFFIKMKKTPFSKRNIPPIRCYFSRRNIHLVTRLSRYTHVRIFQTEE